MQVRQALSNDLPYIYQMEATTFTDAWSLESLETSLIQDFATILVLESKVQPQVNIADGKLITPTELDFQQASVTQSRQEIQPTAILGYLLFWQVMDEIEIQRFCIDQSKRGKGLGRFFLNSFIAHIKDFCLNNQPVAKINLEVRSSNVRALNLYLSTGFIKAGERKNYYTKPSENAILLDYIFT